MYTRGGAQTKYFLTALCLVLSACASKSEQVAPSSSTPVGSVVSTTVTGTSPIAERSTTAAPTTTAPQPDRPANPHDVVNALTDAGLCESGAEFDRPPGGMEAAGLVPPVSEWQCRSTVGLVLVQQFATAADLHDAAVVVTAAGMGDAPVLDLGNGLVLDANNGADPTIAVGDETAWLTKAVAVTGGTIVPMKDL